MYKRDFKTTSYFSGTSLFLGVLLIFLAAFFIPKWIVTISLVAIGVFILTAHYRLRIDFANKTYYDYLWMLGIKRGEKGSFTEVEYLFLKPSKINQSMHSRGSSTTISKYVIDAYIKLSPDKKIHLFTRDSRHDVIVRLKEIAAILNTRVIDYTTEEPEEIRL